MLYCTLAVPESKLDSSQAVSAPFVRHVQMLLNLGLLHSMQGSSDSTHGVAISLNRCSTGTREQARGRTCILTDNRRASKIWSLRSTGQSNQGGISSQSVQFKYLERPCGKHCDLM